MQRFIRRSSLLFERLGLSRVSRACAVVSIAVALLINSLLGPPIVFSDEFSYLAASLGFGQSSHPGTLAALAHDLPNRLYFAVFSVVKYSQIPVATARTLNVAALGLGLLVLYIAARRMRGAPAVVAILCAYGLGGLSSYSAYFMPEVLFGSCFMAGALLMTLAITESSAKLSAVAGTLCALLVFIKPHGWPIVVVLVAFSLVSIWRTKFTRLALTHATVPAFVVVFVTIWFLLRGILPGNAAGRGYLGAMYSNVVSDSLRTSANASEYRSVARLLLTHILVLACTLAPALLYGVRAVLYVTTIESAPAKRIAHMLAAFCALVLLALVVMTSIFTVAVTGLGPGEVANRLHGRYFNFVIPLLLLAFTCSDDAERFLHDHGRSIVAVWGIACALAFVVSPHFVWGFVDYPDIFFGWHAPKWMYALFGIVGIASAIFRWGSRRALIDATLLAYTASALVSGAFVREVQVSIGESTEDRIGEFASALARQHKGSMLLSGDSMSVDFYRIASYLPLNSQLMARDRLNKEINVGSVDSRDVIVGDREYLRASPIREIAELGRWVVASPIATLDSATNR